MWLLHSPIVCGCWVPTPRVVGCALYHVVPKNLAHAWTQCLKACPSSNVGMKFGCRSHRCIVSSFTSHLLATLALHHTFTVSFQAQNSPFPPIFSTSLLAPTWTAFSDYTGPDLLFSTVFHF